MSQTAAHLVDHVIPHVPVRQWVRLCQLRLPIPLRVLLAAQHELVTPVLQVVQRVVERHLLDHPALKSDEGQGGAVTLIQSFGSAANLAIHLHCLVLDGVYRSDAHGGPVFTEASAPTDEEACTLRPLQAPAITYRIAFGPRAGQKVLTLRAAMPREATSRRARAHQSSSTASPSATAASSRCAAPGRESSVGETMRRTVAACPGRHGDQALRSGAAGPEPAACS